MYSSGVQTSGDYVGSPIPFGAGGPDQRSEFVSHV